LMSSNESRLSSCVRRSTLCMPDGVGLAVDGVADIVQHAALSARRCWLSWIACWAGGEADERSRAAVGAGRVRSAPPEPGCGPRPVVHHGCRFFLASDKVQVKYAMLRAHLVDQLPVTEAAVAHGYSRAAFYLVSASFDQLGMAGLLDERRGRRGPVKLTPEIVEFIRSAAPGSGAQVAEQVADRFGVRLHRRTVERVRGK